MFRIVRDFFGSRPPSRGQHFRIYAYHGVVERKRDHRLERNLHELDEFRKQVHVLRRENIVALADLPSIFANYSVFRRAISVITFDDGYENNILAQEILASYRLPCTIFVTTGPVTSGQTIWTVELSLLLLYGQARGVEALGELWDLSSRKAREASFQTLRYRIKTLPATERVAVSQSIRQQFPAGEMERLLDEFPAMRLLNWSQVAHLAAGGVEIGSHGVDHEIHHEHQPLAIRWQELTASKTEIESRLRRPCTFFSFPNGNYVSQSADEITRAGYTIGVTMVSRPATAESDLRTLPRLTPPGTSAQLARELNRQRA
ncbi:MAG: polysaccharide deacetylase family protein [Bryobacteraceae bacterium]|nr:polysaccharide deacetylase family protein [Bryobacteraceae bacterium]